jgi:hypothetical protein
VVRYAFPVRLFHSLLHAGLSRRYPGETACPTRVGDNMRNVETPECRHESRHGSLERPMPFSFLR